MKPVLEVAGLTQDFGGLRALNELDLTVRRKEIVALIGPNGAGKTHLLQLRHRHLQTHGRNHVPDHQGREPASS